MTPPLNRVQRPHSLWIIPISQTVSPKGLKLDPVSSRVTGTADEPGNLFLAGQGRGNGREGRVSIKDSGSQPAIVKSNPRSQQTLS